MPRSEITIEEFAYIREQATVYGCIDLGPLLITTGHHPERGAFVVTQTMEGFYLIAELDPFIPEIPVDVDLVGMAWRVMRDLDRRAGFEIHDPLINFLELPQKPARPRARCPRAAA